MKPWGIFRKAVALLLTVAVVMSCLMLFTSCDSPTYMKIGGVEVPYDVVRCFVKQQLQLYSEDELADSSIRETIRRDVTDALKKIYASRAIADEYGISLDRLGKKEIKVIMEAYRETEGYDAMLEEMFASDEVIEELEICTYFDNLVYDHLCENNADFSDSPEAVDADLATDRWYAAEYIILLYDSTNYYARKEDLQEVRSAISEGESLKDAASSVQKLYSSEYFYDTDGCFTDTIYSEEFENTVKALSEGDVSDVVTTTTSDGYACLMLIRRLAISRDYVEANYDTVSAYYLARVYAEYMEARAEELTVEIAKKYKDSDLLDID